MNSSPSPTPLNLVTSEEIQKVRCFNELYIDWCTTDKSIDEIQKLLDDNGKLIIAIMQFQQAGHVAEAAQLQSVLQKNLMYLAAIADAQDPNPEQQPTSSISQQKSANVPEKNQPSFVQRLRGQQQGVPVPKLFFDFDASKRQEQQNQRLQFQQHQQQGPAQYTIGVGSNNGLQLFLQPATGSSSNNSGNSMDMRGSNGGVQPQPSYGLWQAKLGLGPPDQGRQ